MLGGVCPSKLALLFVCFFFFWGGGESVHLVTNYLQPRRPVNNCTFDVNPALLPPPHKLTQALSPTLTFLRNGEGEEQVDAVTLLGSICENRPGAAAFLVAEGALPPVAKLVVTGVYG